MPARRAPPWKKPNPTKKTGGSRTLSAAAKSKAKRAGRPYPNLVDNMRAAREDKGR